MNIFKTINELQQFRGIRGSAVTIGNFDGCHLGHEALFEGLKVKGSSKSDLRIAITFYPHPAVALGAKHPIKLIQSIKDRQSCLQEAGFDVLLQLEFTAEFRNLSSDDFIKRYLVDGCGAKRVVVGDDFCFGKNRGGTISHLQDAAKVNGFDVVVVPPVIAAGHHRVSSTLIRKLIGESGDLQLASTLLGRPWTFCGDVIQGDKIGRTIGFPTANLDLGEIVVPSCGVYAGWLYPDAIEAVLGKKGSFAKSPVVMNIGRRPTVSQAAAVRVEVHVLRESSGSTPSAADFDLYGKTLRIEPVKKLRDEVKFSTVDELKKQISIDCKNTLSLLMEKNLG
jgi:riboflavin kinase/FMN adenylyltransferase